tara:strand:- start:15 stop:146 length:132 start_codon:yes stop_codon:yes gene_type:complete
MQMIIDIVNIFIPASPALFALVSLGARGAIEGTFKAYTRTGAT